MMGILLAYGIVITIGFWTAFVVIGDTILTLILQTFAKSYIGPRFAIQWSIRDGLFEIRSVEVGSTLLKIFNDILAMPVKVEKLSLDRFQFQMPLVSRFLFPRTLSKALQSSVYIGGFEVGSSIDNPEDWVWMKEENIQRYQQAVKDAGAARLARANAWTVEVVQKLQQLAERRHMKDAAVNQVPVANQVTSNTPVEWQKTLDEIVDSISIIVQQMAITVRDRDSASGIGITMERFELNRAQQQGADSNGLRQRVVRVVDFEVFLNTSVDQTDSILTPMTMELFITIPAAIQSIIMLQGSDYRPAEIKMVFPEPLVIQLRPKQITKLLSMLRPYQFYSEWYQRALLVDEAACVDLTDEEKEEYKQLYPAQYRLEHEMSQLRRMLVQIQDKSAISVRKERLGSLETRVLATQLLCLRARALEWAIPRGGEPLDETHPNRILRKDLQSFLSQSIDTYEAPVPSPAMINSINFSLSMPHAEIQLRQEERSLLTLFERELTITLSYHLETNHEEQLTLKLSLPRFGLLDDRNLPSNVFHRLLDRNPNAVEMLRLDVSQLKNQHVNVKLALQDFSFVLLFDPLLDTMNAFLPALVEDEATQMRFLPFTVGNRMPRSPEAMEDSHPVYKHEISSTYSPLFLGGISLSSELVLKGVEVCLIGDSKSLDTHVLAFTSDTTIKLASSKYHEAFVIELVDVALQPCSLVMLEEGIDLELAGLRTILELEGEGVDLMIGYRLKLSSVQPIQRVVSGKELWDRAREKLPSKQIAEVDMESSVDIVKAPRPKSKARRKVIFVMSDFALNLSANDVGVFLSIISSLNEAMHEDEEITKERMATAQRLATMRLKLEETRYRERLKSEFQVRDTDGGGTLDAEEVKALIASVGDCQQLTKDELNALVVEFVSIVDRDGSGDVSLQEFEAVLSREKVVYHQLHHDVVALTGQEYVDPYYQTVPRLNSNSMANLAHLVSFWKRYEEQIGASKTSLNGQSPLIVQKKMVRTFKNYDYAQQAWNHLVNPSLVKPVEQSEWVLTKDMDMGSRGNVLDQLLTQFQQDEEPCALACTPAKMFIHTIVSTKLGGFYLRFIDETLPVGTPSIEISGEELMLYANFAIWEGPSLTQRQNYGIAKLSFAIYGKYYNRTARQVEPFLEYYQGTVDIRKEPDTALEIGYLADRYFQLNLTFAFMEVVHSTLVRYTHVERMGERIRPHIQEQGGLFWLVNDTGVSLSYFVVAKKNLKDRIRVETVSAVTHVPNAQVDACKLLTVDEEMMEHEQQSLKEKQLRQAFRRADADGSGELDTHEVEAVLRHVFEQEMKERSSLEVDRMVNDFIVLADTDGSGQVSWEEFKIAIAHTREQMNRFLSLQVDGFEPLEHIPIAHFGQTQVYELVPYYEEIAHEKDVSVLYQTGVELLLIDEPTREDRQRAFACLHRVREEDPQYQRIHEVYAKCLREYLPLLLSIQIQVDGVVGLQVRVTGGEYLQNDTMKPMECQLVDAHYEVCDQNPSQPGTDERFLVIPPHESYPIPLDLADVGYFAIRQVGETEWSNYLSLSIREQRLYTQLTRYEQTQILESKKLNGMTARRIQEHMGNNVPIPNVMEEHEPGQHVVFPSAHVIDNQPTIVIQTISCNHAHRGTWSLVIQPQLTVFNGLPCGLEYMIVQALDCPPSSLDSNGQFIVEQGTEALGTTSLTASRTSSSILSKSRKGVKVVGPDYFEYVNEVNGRHLYVESGRRVEVFGLDLQQPALMRVRLCADRSTCGDTWSGVFMIRLQAPRSEFDGETFELRFGQGPNAVFVQEWQPKVARNLVIYSPYWIQNRTGLDFIYRVPKGEVCSIERHREYFRGDKQVPLLVNAPLSKAMVSAKPYQVTPRRYASDFFLSKHTKMYLPHFESVEWSEAHDMTRVGTKGEFRSSAHGDGFFVVAYEILAAPSQFYRSKILRLTPRVVLVSRVARPLQITPIMLDKKNRSSRIVQDQNESLEQGDALAVYRCLGTEKHQMGIRLRDIYRDEALPRIGEWSPPLPVIAGEDYNIWTRGSLGDGPVLNVAYQNTEETIYATICDISTTPRYRIENRSTRYSIRYVQSGLKPSEEEELVVGPLCSHTFVWTHPLMEPKVLKVTPVHWKIPTKIDLMKLGTGPQLLPDGLYSEVYLDGLTRVFAVGDTPCSAIVRQQVSDWFSSTLVHIAMHGVGITIVDGHPQEILNLTMETLSVVSRVGSRAIEFSLHHFQIDDMTPQALYPVVLAPLDSGYNSEKQEGWLPTDTERPFLLLTIETSAQTGVLVLNTFDLHIHSVCLKLNLEYWIGLGTLLYEFIPSSTEEIIAQQGAEYKTILLSLELNIPEQASHGGTLMYFKQWRLHSFDVHLVFDSVVEERGEGISSIFGNTVGSIVGGIAHITPEFTFHEIIYQNRYFYEYDLIYSVVLDFIYSVLGQWYKIVGSVELLGDPVGLATDIVDGFALAARQLRRTVKGKSIHKGESALTLVQTIVGAPMKSIGKVSNGLGDVVKKAVDFESQEEAEQPRHLPDGFVQSGVVFTKSLAHGVKGFVREPVRGAKSGGIKGFAKGVGRGTLQLVASPVVGTLGVVEKMSQSVNNTTHLFDEKSFDGPRRPARDITAAPLKSLSDSNVITELELHILRLEGLPPHTNTKVTIRIYHQGDPSKEVLVFKTSTVRNRTTPIVNQSWLISITSNDTVIEIQVHHKRKPLPKRFLGSLRFTMEEIYHEFTGVPAKLVADSKAKLRLKKRKRYIGSILNELGSSGGVDGHGGVEVRDESWRGAINRLEESTYTNAMMRFTNEDDDEQDEMEPEEEAYERDFHLLSSRSVVINASSVSEAYPERIREFELKGGESGIKMYLSMRYVNDMRRYA